MLTQNTNKVNQAREIAALPSSTKMRDSSQFTKSGPEQAHGHDQSTTQQQQIPRSKNTQLPQSERTSNMKLRPSTATQQNARKARKTFATASKENNNGPGADGSAIMARAFKVVVNGADTSYSKETNYNLLNRSQTKTSFASKHFTPGKKIQQKRVIPPRVPSVFKSWPSRCPCQNESDCSRLIEAPEGHFNCVNCGAKAIKQDMSASGGTQQPIYALKPWRSRQKCQVAPHKIISQLRESAEAQRAELQRLVHPNGSMDERILHMRRLMLQLILEVGDCLRQSQLTVHLSIEYLDRYLLLRNHFSDHSCAPSESEFVKVLFEGHSLDTVALCCLLLASKFDEIDDNIPMIEEFSKAHELVRDSLDAGFLNNSNAELVASNHLQFPGRTYPGTSEIEKCEIYLLNKLCWDLNTITPMHFINQHLYHGVVFTCDNPKNGPEDNSEEKFSDSQLLSVQKYVEYFAKLAAKQDFMLSKLYSDQVVAASVIYAARETSEVVQEGWNKQVCPKVYEESNFAQIQECHSKLMAAYKAGKSNREEATEPSQVVVNAQPRADIKFASVDTEEIEAEGAQTDRSASLMLKVNSESSQELEKLSHEGYERAVCSTNDNEVSNGDQVAVPSSNGNTIENDECFSRVVSHSTKNSISMSKESNQASEAQNSSEDMKRKQLILSASKCGQKSTSFLNKQKQSSNKLTNPNLSKSKPKARSGQQPTTASHSHKTSITSFDQQQQLFSTRPSLQLTRATDFFGQPDGNSLSPVKEYHLERKDTGPIKVFRPRQPINQRDGCSRERSSSSTSAFRLQPTMMVNNLQSKRQSDSSKKGLQLQAATFCSDQNQLKRGQSGSRQNSTTPRVHNFLRQSRPQSKPKYNIPPTVTIEKKNIVNPNQNEFRDKKVTPNSRDSSKDPLNRLLLKQKQAVERSDPESRRFQVSKSIIFNRKTIDDLSISRSEIPDQSQLITETKQQETERSSLKNVRLQAKSALSQIKVFLQGESVQSTRNREQQNFIRKNINYVSQLDQNTKERRSLQPSYSFIELDSRQQKHVNQQNNLIVKSENQQQVSDDSKFGLKSTSLKPTQARRAGQTPSQGQLSSQYQSNTFTLHARAASKSVLETSKLDTEPDAAYSVLTTNITPKQVSSYRASKLFSKKTTATNSSLNVSQTDVGLTMNNIAEQQQHQQPRPSNASKTALHKFKHSAQVRQSAKGSSSLLQQPKTLQLTLASVIDETVMAGPGAARDSSVTPQDTSQGMTAQGTLTASKQRPSNNHLRPTKSSMLRAKSSLGLPQHQEASEVPGKGGGVTAKSSLMQEILVSVPDITHGQWGAHQEGKPSSRVVSPQFGAQKSRKSRLGGPSGQSAYKQLELVSQSSHLTQQPSSQQQPTSSQAKDSLIRCGGNQPATPAEPSGKKSTQQQRLEDKARKQSAAQLNAGPRKLQQRRSSASRVFNAKFSAKPSQQLAQKQMTTSTAKQHGHHRERSQLGSRLAPQSAEAAMSAAMPAGQHAAAATSASKATENSKIQVKSHASAAFRGSFQFR